MTTNWSDNANWNNSAGGFPGFTNNDVVFGAAGAALNANEANSLVDSSASSLSLTFTNGSGLFHTAFIPSGVTLTNAGGLTVGGRSEINSTAYNTYASLAGGGTFLQNGTPFTVINFGTNASTSLATFDLSGLTNFVYNNSGGTMNIANATSGNRFGGLFLLAAISNNVTVNTINFFQNNASNAGNGNNSGIRFGAGTNVINVGTFNVVGGKNSGTVTFQTTTGGLRLRGVNGNNDDNSRANLTVAVRTSTGTGTTTGNLSLNGHPVDIKVGTLTVGQDTQSGGNSANATIQFDAGVLDATAINMGIASNAAVVSSTGTITVGADGKLVIGPGGMSIVNLAAGAAATGNLNVNGGTVEVNGNIRKSSLAGIANISLSGGKLHLGATNTIGSTSTNIDNLNLTDASLTLPAVNGGAPVAVGALNINGTADTITVSSLPGTSTFPTQYPLITYTSLNGTFDFTLGAPLPGSYQGYISNNTAGFSIDLVVTNSAVKSDVWRGNVSGNWDTSTLNWFSSGNPVTYQQGDFVTFNDSLTGTPNVNVTTSVSPGAFGVNNTTPVYVFSGSGKITGPTSLAKQGSGTVTLAGTGGDDFAGGIIIDNGTVILDNVGSAISGGVTINGGALQIGNNDANGALPSGNVTDNGTLRFVRSDNLTVSAPIAGTGSLVHNGTGTLTLTGVNTYSGPTAATNGTLALSGSGTLSNSASVTLRTAILDVSALTQPAVIQNFVAGNAGVTIAPNSGDWAAIAVSSLTTEAPGNVVNVTAFPPIASYPVTFKVIQAAAPFGSQNFSVGNLPAGYSAVIGSSPDQTTVLLVVNSGPVSSRPFALWTGADLPNLNTNWSDRLNWQLPGPPVAGDTLLFNTNGAVAASALATPGGGPAVFTPENINNIADGDFNLSALIFTNTGVYHNTLINSGRRVSVTNNAGVSVGVFDSGASAQQVFVSVSGAGGTLSLSNTNANLQVWTGSGSVGGSQSVLDLSALNRFDATVSRLLVGATIGNVVNRPSGVVYLARTNNITAASQTTTIENGTTTGNAGIVVADCNQNAGSQSSIWLGQANTIKTDTLAIGRQKANARLLFNPIYANTAPYPFVSFQGYNSGQMSVFDVGDSVGNAGTTSLNADANLTGGFVTATVDTMNIGRASSGGTSGTTTGSLEFDAGLITVNNLTVGLQPSASKVGVGTFGVGSNTVLAAAATLVVKGNLGLGIVPPGTASSLTSGTLNITNGSVFANNIVAGTNSTSNLGVYGGVLGISNVAGTVDAPLTSFSLLPQGTPDNVGTVLILTAGVTPAVTATTFNLDGQGGTTNVINIAAGPTATGEFPLIKYGSMNLINGAVFNLGLGTLPPNYAGYLTNDTAINAIALVLTAAPHARPATTSVSLQGGSIVFSGTNGYAGGNYNVLASTNVALPLSQWTPITTGNFDGSGNFTISIPVDPTKPERYFVLQVP